ncbi:14-3-3 protein beta/alpha-A [Schistosoma japonicum]|nr:14-3-3 protein beta/alpha-A [Schistosoma japonicum]
MCDESWINKSKIQDRESLVALAKISDQSERYNDMACAMKKVVEMPSKLNNEERNLFSAAYKNVVGCRRSAWRIVSSIEQKLEEEKKKRATEYRTFIENELQSVCQEVLDILDKFLIKSDDAPEDIVFYRKMKGDYYRYLAEFQTGDKRAEAIKHSKEAYEAATAKATSDLPPTHPIRLGLALNFSVFYYEIENNPEKACTIAQNAFNESIELLDQPDSGSLKDSTLVMQLLRDNLTVSQQYTIIIYFFSYGPLNVKLLNNIRY